jgi:hypothetical protein
LPLLLDPLLGTSGCSGASSPADLVFAIPITAPFAGARFFAQHVGLEPVAGGLSWSNGLAFAIR